MGLEGVGDALQLVLALTPRAIEIFTPYQVIGFVEPQSGVRRIHDWSFGGLCLTIGSIGLDWFGLSSKVKMIAICSLETR